MAKIALRAYFREIESLIEHGQLDEASAHCRQVLQYYPKLIAAYRLLGKAYLEDQRYSDAADIFQRVLSSVPEDFVSNVGMSIIREDEGNLDAAIWHMERAFEVQPYNAAIQDELRRLFQRRDNVEPHKIRLTRGALARMYAKGDLYQQAIAELQAAQTEDPQRPDLQILLARMYYLNGMLVEAVDICSSLLKKLPYCLEANRLLGAILPTTERKDEAKIYQQRVATLDPYIAAAPITSTSSDSVPDNIAVIDKLDYKAAAPGAETPSQPAWAASLGVSLEGFTPAEEPLPDWMAMDDQETPLAGKEKTPPAGQEPAQEQSATTKLPWETPTEISSGIPDWMSSPRKGAEETSGGQTPAVSSSLVPNWMKEAGWEPPSGAEEPPSDTIPLEGAAPPEAGIARAEIPDWLRDMAPPPTGQGQPEEETTFPWDQASTSITGEELPDWLAGIHKEEEGEPVSPGPGEETPGPPVSQEWQFETPSPVTPATPTPEIPDWLQSIEKAGAAEGVVTGETRPSRLEEPAPAEQMPLEEVEIQEAAGPAIAEPEAVEPPVSEPPAAGPGFDLADQDAALAWLEGLAAKQGISEEQLITRPEDRTGELPAWLQEAKEIEAPQVESQAPGALPIIPESEFTEWLPEEATHVEPSGPAAERPATGAEQVPSAPEGQAVLPDWLSEALSEKPAPEGAPPEGLAEQATELPDWLQEARHEEPAEYAPSLEPAEEEQAGLPDWLKTLGELPVQEEAIQETPAEPTPPEPTVFETATIQPPVAEPAAPQPPTTEPGFDLTDQDAALAWLESLAARQGVSEEQLFTRPEERSRELPGMLEETTPVPPETPKLGDTQPLPKIHAPEPEQAAETTLSTEPVPQTAEMPAALVEELKAMELPPVEVAPVEEIAPVAPEIPTPEQQIPEPTPAEGEPELPSWIAEVAAGQPAEEEYTWMPPAIAAQAAMAETAPPPEPPAVVPPVQEAPTIRISTPARRAAKDEEEPININTASLIELENLPGVGFIQAQNILAYRDAHGPFERVEDLAKVPGFNPEVLDEIRERLIIGAKEQAAAPAFEELRPEEADPDQAILIQARNALIQENVAETVTRYSYLIKRERMLDTVIRDLYEALYHFPMDVSIWQTLGDAYVRNNQLQEALDAYIKAEELLR